MPRVVELSKDKINKISIVCPYFNEAAIIEQAVKTFFENISSLKYGYELILVNDGSMDGSFEIVKNAVKGRADVVLVTYPHNEGRGHALKTGINAATGDIIVTTEIDLSWGEDIVHRIVRKFEEEPNLDCVIASPNLPEGCYRNVPFKRVLISKVGNMLIRLFFVPEISMNTGMTRGYRRGVIQGLHFFEKGKEFHLEVLLKLYTLGFRIGEVPAVLQWKKFGRKSGAPKRKSSTKIGKVIKTHLNFLFFSRPLKYFWVLSLILIALSAISFGTGVYYLLSGVESLWMGMTALLFAIFGVLFFGFGIVAEQNMNILRELWKKRD